VCDMTVCFFDRVGDDETMAFPKVLSRSNCLRAPHRLRVRGAVIKM
jgi:hypothetical protein